MTKQYQVKCTDGTWQNVTALQAANYKSAGSEVREVPFIHPALTHYIVCDGGEWGKGATIREATANRPHPRSKLSKDAFAYRVTPDTYIDDNGRLCRPKADPAPVLIDNKTGEPKE